MVKRLALLSLALALKVELVAYPFEVGSSFPNWLEFNFTAGVSCTKRTPEGARGSLVSCLRRVSLALERVLLFNFAILMYYFLVFHNYFFQISVEFRKMSETLNQFLFQC